MYASRNLQPNKHGVLQVVLPQLRSLAPGQTHAKSLAGQGVHAAKKRKGAGLPATGLPATRLPAMGATYL